MLNLKLEQLSLHIENAAGHEHRINSITQRATELFAERVNEQWRSDRLGYRTLQLGSLVAQPANINLSRMSDEEAADVIARAWLEALALHLT